jgi:hypothetical protein
LEDETLAGDRVAMFVLFVIRGRLVRRGSSAHPNRSSSPAVVLLASRQLSDWPAAVYR